jgi:hypothetical protein
MLESINKIIEKTEIEIDPVNFRKAESLNKSCFMCKHSDIVDNVCFCMKFKEFTLDMRICNKFDEVI